MAKPLIRIYHLFFGILAAGTLIFDLSHYSSIINFFSYFTIVSNIMSATIFLLIGLKKDIAENVYVNSMRGAIVVYMSVTGVVYAILLSNLVMPEFPQVSFILHKIMPVAVTLGYLVFPPVKRLGFLNSLMWLGFPILYYIYTMLRGLIDHWYPYPFLDPIKHGYGGVFLNFLGITIAAWVLSVIVIFIGNKLHGKEA